MHLIIHLAIAWLYTGRAQAASSAEQVPMQTSSADANNNNPIVTAWGAVCHDIRIPVSVQQSTTTDVSMSHYDLEILFALVGRQILVSGEYELSARLCDPGEDVESKNVIQVLAHGASFNKHMWDFPYKPETYSFVRRMHLAGFSTLAVDLIGAGNSSTPHGIIETQTETMVQTMHQVLAAVRAGEILNRTWDKIAFVGFSIGGIIAVGLADKYPEDFDICVLIGISWSLPWIYPAFLAGLQTAANTIDPDKWGHLEPFYATQPTLEARGVACFYGDYEAEALETDFYTRDTDTLGAATSFTSHLVTAPVFSGPVFLGIGENDITFCGKKCGTQPYEVIERFPRARNHTVKVYPDTGHAIMYHRSAAALQDDVIDFVATHTT